LKLNKIVEVIEIKDLYIILYKVVIKTLNYIFNIEIYNNI